MLRSPNSTEYQELLNLLELQQNVGIGGLFDAFTPSNSSNQMLPPQQIPTQNIPQFSQPQPQFSQTQNVPQFSQPQPQFSQTQNVPQFSQTQNVPQFSQVITNPTTDFSGVPNNQNPLSGQMDDYSLYSILEKATKNGSNNTSVTGYDQNPSPKDFGYNAGNSVAVTTIGPGGPYSGGLQIGSQQNAYVWRPKPTDPKEKAPMPMEPSFNILDSSEPDPLDRFSRKIRSSLQGREDLPPCGHDEGCTVGTLCNEWVKWFMTPDPRVLTSQRGINAKDENMSTEMAWLHQQMEQHNARKTLGGAHQYLGAPNGNNYSTDQYRSWQQPPQQFVPYQTTPAPTNFPSNFPTNFQTTPAPTNFQTTPTNFGNGTNYQSVPNGRSVGNNRSMNLALIQDQSTEIIDVEEYENNKLAHTLMAMAPTAMPDTRGVFQPETTTPPMMTTVGNNGFEVGNNEDFQFSNSWSEEDDLMSIVRHGYKN